MITFTMTAAGSSATAAQVREQIILRNGRYALATETAGAPDYTVPGDIDHFVNEAIIYLCDNVEWLSAEQVKEVAIIQGISSISIDHLREIKSIDYDAIDSDGTDDSLVVMLHRSEEQLRKNALEPLEDIEQGPPLSFAEYTTRVGDTVTVAKLVLLSPPSDGSYTLRVRGTFYPVAFPDELETNWILANHPFLLVTTTLWVIENANKNTDGAEHYWRMLQKYLEGPTKDYYERIARQLEDVDGLIAMEG
jgi:hypothetical protein